MICQTFGELKWRVLKFQAKVTQIRFHRRVLVIVFIIRVSLLTVSVYFYFYFDVNIGKSYFPVCLSRLSEFFGLYKLFSVSLNIIDCFCFSVFVQLMRIQLCTSIYGVLVLVRLLQFLVKASWCFTFHKDTQNRFCFESFCKIGFVTHRFCNQSCVRVLNEFDDYFYVFVVLSSFG